MGQQCSHLKLIQNEVKKCDVPEKPAEVKIKKREEETSYGAAMERVQTKVLCNFLSLYPMPPPHFFPSMIEMTLLLRNTEGVKEPAL